MWYCRALAGSETFGRVSAGSKTRAERVFADMFLGWTYGMYADDISGVGAARRNFMDSHMTLWIVNLVSP